MYGDVETISEYTYNENGNELSYTRLILKNNEWVKTEERKLINEEMKTIFTILNNQDGTFDQSFEYAYDDKGNKISEKNIVYKNDEIDINRIFIYDEAGNIITETYYRYENSEWVYDTKHEYTYDTNRNRTNVLDYIYLNNEWVKIYEGKLINEEIKTIFTIKRNQDGEFNYKYEYTYDEKGNELTQAYYKYENGEWVKY